MLNIHGFDLTVALITEDMVSAKEISSSLRKLNIFGYHYQNLDEFFASTHIKLPDFTIIDVLKLSQGSLQFASHPLVMQEKLEYSIFSKDTSRFLLKSTVMLKPRSYLNLDFTLDYSIKQMFTHFINEKKSDLQLAELSSRVERLKSRNQRIISERSEAEEFRAQLNQIQNFADDVDELMAKNDFTTALINKLSHWKDITAFGLYELSRDGQRLISPESNVSRFQSLPSLFLGNKTHTGIENFAKEMAGQVALDLFEVDPIVIEIKSQKTDLLLYLSFTEEYLINYPWSFFEKEISALHQKSKVTSQSPKLAGQFLPMWEALDYMDKLGQDTHCGLKILVLDLSPLLKIVSSKVSNKFYWSTFFNEFFMQISQVISPATKLSVLGPWEIVFFVEDSALEPDSFALSSFSKKYSYWKYFQDQSSVLPEEIHPVLRISPMNSSLYLRGFEKNHKESDNKLESTIRKQTSQISV